MAGDIVRVLSGGVTYRMTGLADLEAGLNELASDLRRRVVRNGLRDAAKPVVKSARAFARPRDYSSKRRIAGTMRKAITALSSKRYKLSNGAIGIYLTVRATKAQRRARPVSGDPYYWRWVMAGHKIVARFKGNYFSFKQRGRGRLTGLVSRRRKSTGMVQAFPIFEQAFKAQGNNARQIFTGAVLARIAKANARR